MEILGLVVLGSLFSTGVLFAIGLYYSIRNDVRGGKFTAFGMLNFAVSCLIILYYGINQMSLNQIKDLGVAALVFVIMAALFYADYQITKKNISEKKG